MNAAQAAATTTPIASAPPAVAAAAAGAGARTAATAGARSRVREVGAPGAGRRRRRILAVAKWGVAIATLAPATRLGWLFAHGRLGANPVAEAMNQLGLWALILLLASLALTPIKLLTGWTWPIALRRLVGLLALGYAGLHVSWYLGVDQAFDWGDVYRDIVKRRFITVGFAALVLLIPLGITSTAGMLKRLGARRWKRLHRLVYLAAGLAVVHFLWRVKSDLREPLIYAAVLAALLAIRLVAYARRPRKS